MLPIMSIIDRSTEDTVDSPIISGGLLLLSKECESNICNDLHGPPVLSCAE